MKPPIPSKKPAFTIVLGLFLFLLTVQGALGLTYTDLELYYSFDTGDYSGTTVYDLHNSYNGTAADAGVLGAAGFLDKAMYPDATNDYKVAFTDGLAAVSTPRTFSFWYKADSLGSGSKKLLIHDTASGRIDINTGTGNEIQIELNDGSWQTLDKATSDTASWHHVCAIIDPGDYAAFFWDGVQVDSNLSINNLAVGSVGRSSAATPRTSTSSTDG